MKKLIIVGSSIDFKNVTEKLKEMGGVAELDHVEKEELRDLIEKERGIKITSTSILEMESLEHHVDNYRKQPKFQYEDKVHKDRMKYAKRKGG